MSTLHDRLADLAEDGPHGPPSADVWERGRRYGRRRRLETAALTIVLLAAVGSLVGALLPATSYDAGPASSGAGLRLPDRLYTPSPWLRGTDEVGEVGPLVALVAAERKSWTDSRSGVVGVTADGGYAFLDLPGLADGAQRLDHLVALSPDGRRVAYPLTGTPRGEPNTFDGDVVVGVGVYDTVTGESRRHVVETEHGLGLEGLLWVGGTLWMHYGQWDQGADEDATSGSGSDYRVWTWDLEGDARAVPPPLATQMPGLGGGGLVTASARRMRVFDGRDLAVLRDLRLDVAPDATPLLNPSGTRVAVPADGLRAGVVPQGSDVAVRTAPVGDLGAFELRGWRDDWHVLVQDYRRNALVSVDVNTGAQERLVSLSDGGANGVVLAADALAATPFDAPAPPSPMDPRLRLALAVLAVALGAAGLVIWRRRGRV